MIYINILYIYIYICKSQRIFCFHIQLAFFYYYARYIYIYIYISFFLLQCKQGGLNQKLAETGSRYFQNPFKEFTDSLSASPFVFSLSLLISLCLSLFFPSCFWRSVCVCVYIWTQTVPTGFKEYRSTVLFWGATPNQTQKPFFFFFNKFFFWRVWEEKGVNLSILRGSERNPGGEILFRSVKIETLLDIQECLRRKSKSV